MRLFTITGVKIFETSFGKYLEIHFNDGSIATIDMPERGNLPPGAFRKIYEAAEKIHGYQKVREIEQFKGLVFCENDFQKIGIKLKPSQGVLPADGKKLILRKAVKNV